MTLKRRCSCCRRPGHTKNNCPLKGGKKVEAKTKLVYVRFASQHIKSQHIVDLTEQRKESPLDGVNAFQEKAHLREERVVVDLAEMVRKENSKLKNQNSKLTDKAVEMVVKKKHTEDLGRIIKRLITNIKYPISNIQLSFNYRRLAVATIVLFLCVAIPFPTIGYYQKLRSDGAQVVTQSSNAFLSLQSSTVAALQANFLQAQSDLNSALESFSTAQNILDKDHKALVYVMSVLPIVGEQVQSRQHLLLAGHHLALGNTYLVKGIKETGEGVNLPMTEKLSVLAEHLRSAIPQYEEAINDLLQVDESIIPVEYQQSFYDFKILFSTFVNDMKDIRLLSQSLDALLGSEQPKRYLVMFQNPHELRPTGGFMGSFAILDVQKGRVTNLEIPAGGTYDLQGQLDVFIKPPTPLQVLNKRWDFQDANWFPDFPTAAKKIAWFYQHGRNSTVDGVIAINATVLERFLSVLGPLSVEKFGMQVASEDALVKLQKQVEVDYDKEENKPKEVIGDLAGQLLNRMQGLNTISAVRLAAELHEALAQKEIQVFVENQTKELAGLQEFGWTGEIASTNDKQDYLLVVNTSVSGNKSDARMEQTIDHQAVVQDDGSIIDTVVIKRKNNGTKDEQFYGGDNIDYLRVYVPSGAELIEAGGFATPPEQMFKVPEEWYKIDTDLQLFEAGEIVHQGTGTRITQEFGKTAFGNWVITPPGETSVAYVTYKLPFKAIAAQKIVVQTKKQMVLAKVQSALLTGTEKKVYSSYGLLVQKQSGIDSQFTTQIIYPNAWEPVWETNKDLSLALNGAEYGGKLKTDMVFGLIMEKSLE